ncbi:MAG: DUF554 domain-containing protein [Ruminococcaceae bacterium]|nr:DUF554 domain-containing protein [Oscillospiraceae bacterium]
MIGLGTIVNVAAIIVGGCLGTFLRGGLKEHYQTALTHTLGLATIFIGISGALPGMLEVADGQLVGKDTLGMVLALALGTLIGEFLDFDGWLERLGRWLKERAARSDDARFVEGFVTASLVVCVGAMAIVGSIQDGLTGNPATLYTKSILDFTIVMVFASTYGRGAIFSALPVGVLQGGVTLLSGLVAPLFTPDIIANLSFLGSILIFCVGINLVFGNRFRVANMLPALVLGGLYTALF